MKIATWNVNSIRTRLEQVTNWLSDREIDILCLQETKVVDKDFPSSAFEELDYHVYCYGQKSYNGVAIISRQPLQDVRYGFSCILDNIDSRWDEQKRAIAGKINDIRIVNLYVPNGSAVGSEKYEYKLGWLKTLQDYIEESIQSDSATCICGDFNIALENKDIHDDVKIQDHIMSSETERQALQEILTLGFADAFRKFTLDAGHYSWWDYRAASFRRNRGWRIDHVYLTPELYERATSCTIDKAPRKLTKPSDHAPVILELCE